jgi:predicted MFS family arabinose efflux permease
MLVMPLIVNRLISAYGWRTTFTVLGVLMLLSIMLFAQFLIRDPAKMGILPDNAMPSEGEKNLKEEQGSTFQDALRSRSFWTLCAINFIFLLCVLTIITHIVQHAIDTGIPAARAARFLSTIGGVSIAGRLIMGGAGDRIGNRPALMICTLFMLAGLALLLFSKTEGMFYAFSALYGFAHGGFFALGSPLVAWLFGIRSHGTIFGVVIFSSTLGGAMGPILAGTLFDFTRSYQGVFIFLIALSLLALILCFSLKPVHNP